MEELIIYAIITVLVVLWAWLILRTHKSKKGLWFKSSFQVKMLKKYKE